MKIIIENLNKKFKKKQVLNQINCEIYPHIYGIVGPNGSGKTTFIRCLLQIINYQSGTIQYVDNDGHKIPFSNIQIGYLPQTFDAFKDLTVYEQLEYFLVLKKCNVEDNDSEINRVIKLVRLERFKDEKCGVLSGGMIRRLGIAQALLGSPDVLLFDEPTAGLDPNERLNFKEILRTVDLDIPIILSTHIIEDISSLCSHVIFMKDGQIVYNGEVDTLLNRGDCYVYLCQEENLQDIHEKTITRSMGNDNIRIISFEELDYEFLTLVNPNLNDVYQLINYEK